MAIIELGQIIAGIRGTIGGVTYSANAATPYAKAYRKPRRQRTARQNAQRSLFSSWAPSWQALTAGERAGWDTYAADPNQELTNSLGQGYFVSGFNWFVRINTHLAQASEAARTAAPTLTRPVAPSIDNVTLRETGGAGTSRIQYAAADPNATMNRVIFATIRNTQALIGAPRSQPFMIIAVQNGLRQVDFQTELEAIFGAIVLGQRLFATTYTQDSHGQRSAPTVAQVNATA